MVCKTASKQHSFSERVVTLALSIPKGRVTTYGHLAYAAGAGPMASQSITSILSKATQNGVKNIPYHRIVYAGGKIWTSSEYDKERRKRYKAEGIEVDEKGRIKNFETVFISFKNPPSREHRK
jgi:alkylated DNA nucleotide flippase Atl1